MVKRLAQFNPKSLYGRLVLLTSVSALILFTILAFVIYFITSTYMEAVIEQCGNRVVTIVDESLRRNMMTDAHAELQAEIDILQSMPGLGAIHIYDAEGVLRHTGSDINVEENRHLSCTGCHGEEVPTGVVTKMSCTAIEKHEWGRSLLIMSPILNEATCSAADCHAHADEDRMLGVLEVQLPLDQLDQATNRTLRDYFLAAGIFLIVFATVLLLFIRRRVHDPLKQIIQASEQVSSGNLDLRLDSAPSAVADIRQVEEAFNSMLQTIKNRNEELQRWSRELEQKVRQRTEDLQRTQHEFYHIERLASMGKLSSSVAHEINNPLAGVLTYTKLINRMVCNLGEEQPRRDSLLKHLHMIESETKRCGDIVKGLMDFSREEQDEFEEVAINSVLEEVHQLMDHSFHMANVTLETEFAAPDDRVRANANQIKQACMAILMNALEAVPQDEGRILFRSFDSADGQIGIQIADNGTGIAPEDQEHIFEPFFTRKKDSSGTGLGLAVTYGIINRHRGKILVDSVPGKGTTMTIMLPGLTGSENSKHDSNT